jgi:hypothetical protein
MILKSRLKKGLVFEYFPSWVHSKFLMVMDLKKTKGKNYPGQEPFTVFSLKVLNLRTGLVEELNASLYDCDEFLPREFVTVTDK